MQDGKDLDAPRTATLSHVYRLSITSLNSRAPITRFSVHRRVMSSRRACQNAVPKKKRKKKKKNL